MSLFFKLYFSIFYSFSFYSFFYVGQYFVNRIFVRYFNTLTFSLGVFLLFLIVKIEKNILENFFVLLPKNCIYNAKIFRNFAKEAIKIFESNRPPIFMFSDFISIQAIFKFMKIKSLCFF